MTTRKQKKLASVIKEVVSEGILYHLNDPRIEGLVSVTRVELTADSRNADVYLSSFGKDAVAQRATFRAIKGAGNRLRAFLADELRTRHCPFLRFHMDDEFKELLETYRLIDEAASEYREQEPPEQQ